MKAAWPRVSLADLLRLERHPVKVEPTRLYPEIGIYCFGRGIFHKPARTGLEVGAKDLFLMKKGDFILQITFAWEGAVAVVSQTEDGMSGSSRYPTFKVDASRCSPQFLLNYFKTPEGLEQLSKISPGSAGRNRVLSLKRISEVMVPLPSLPEQRRVVERIETLSTLISEAHRLREETVTEARELCRSIIQSDKHAQLVPMKELVKLRSPDVTVEPNETYQFAGVYSFGRGVFRSQAKAGSEFVYPRLTRVRSGNFTYPKLMAWEGALGVVPPECDGCVVSTEFPVFDVIEERVLPEVLDTYFRTPEIWPELSGASTGTNARRRRLNPNDFLDYKLPLPSRSVQQRLRTVKAALQEVEQLRDKAAIELGALIPSILSKAFAGQLL